MTGPISRRRLLSWMALVSGAALSRADAEEEKPSDRGIGGTGISSAPDGARLGAIGFIGTIQRFGSIYVNDARITYPKNVAVWVDGRRRDASALAIGSVVRTIAHEEKGKLVTHQIEMISEVIGPISSLTDDTLVVLGQRVRLSGSERPSWWQPGVRAAVCGIRMADGTIVGTDISPAGDRPDQIIGTPTMHGWNLRIGEMPLLGISPGYSGWRIMVRGVPTTNGLRIQDVSVDAPFAGKDVARVSVETYVARSGDGFRSGTGIAFRDSQLAGLVSAGSEARAVMDVVVGTAGNVQIQQLRLEGGGGPLRLSVPPSGIRSSWQGLSGPANGFKGGTFNGNGMGQGIVTAPDDVTSNVSGALRGAVGLGTGPSGVGSGPPSVPPTPPGNSFGAPNFGPGNNMRGIGGGGGGGGGPGGGEPGGFGGMGH